MSKNVPNCNRSFLIESLLENKRIDNRTFYQSRNLQVNFGSTFGSCFVQLGNTTMFASTEATLDEPRITRPSEGRFKVAINIGAGGKERWLRNIERSQPTEAILTTRLLEKIFNRINVIDLESLCLITGKTVWCICTKLVLLNFDGNLIETASIATIASLMHFKRPDATVTPDGDIIVHSFGERNPLPLTLFHYPICVTFQFMDRTHLKKILTENQDILPEQHEQFIRKAQQLLICDPTEEEEDFLQNVLIICANVYKEIVAIQALGPLSLQSFSQHLLRSCTDKAFERVKFVTNYLKQTLQSHIDSNGSDNFHKAMIDGDLCIARNYHRHPVLGDDDDDHHQNQNREDDRKLLEKIDHDNIGFGGPSKWTIQMNETFENMDDDDDDDEDNNADMNGQSKFEIRTTQLTDLQINDDDADNDRSQSTDRKPSGKIDKPNKWKMVDKKKAATESDIKSTIKKFNEKTKKEKAAIIAAAATSADNDNKSKDNNNSNDDDEEESATVQLQWEFNTTSTSNKSKNKKKKK